MNKIDFFNELEKKISSLPKKYVKDILSDYKEYFEDGEIYGKKEQQIIEELGSTDRIAHSIMQEYYIENPKVIKDLNTFMKALKTLNFIGISSLGVLIGIPLVIAFVACYVSFYLLSFCCIITPLVLIIHLITPNLPISFGTDILWQKVIITCMFFIVGICIFKGLEKGRKKCFSYIFKLLTKTCK
ncbi:DUF1700 domain-containing protein [Clostridium baratii]|uniref:DUF1700 domain-containing protein n=1 Tax=Clostridium baratii TaxID=1561 RepID=UPI0030D25806